MSARNHSFACAMPFGAEVGAGGTRFRLWAPTARSVSLALHGAGTHRRLPMPQNDDGWFEMTVADAVAGARYQFVIDDQLGVPDPASRYQPFDVHGPSEVIDPRRYAWRNHAWRGRPWEEAVIYELHVGTFSPAGTFRGVIDKLDALVDLGVTAIELMPVADFPGARDWGYDGALLFAADAQYGCPDDLKALIDAAHDRDLMVFLDVVYNHFGPEGNYLYVYARSFFNAERHTAWGAAINFDGPDSRWVREFFIANAIYWLQEYQFDGLRLDAVHAIDDRSTPHILREIAQRVDAAMPADRHVHLILENDANEARWLCPTVARQSAQYTAQWNDDSHHAYHELLTGESEGYFADYADDPGQHLARCLTEGFAYQDDPSPFRDGARRGTPSLDRPLTAFVNFLQNHDQIGNRAFGERIAQLTSAAALRAAVAVLLLSPSPPLLFMGEEWAAPEPFLFFCDFGDDLRDAVREGRRREFAHFAAFQHPETRARIPDPTAASTFEASKLDWRTRDAPEHVVMLEHYRRLLALRRAEIVPRLPGLRPGAGRMIWRDGPALLADWQLGDGSRLLLRANLGAKAKAMPPQSLSGRLLFATAPSVASASDLPAWSVAWSLCETT